MFTCVLGRYIAFTVVFEPKPFLSALTESIDSCAEIKSAPSVVQPILAEFGGRWLKAMLGVCGYSPTHLCSHNLMFSQLYCPHIYVLPAVLSTYLCSPSCIVHISMLFQAVLSTYLCSPSCIVHISMFSQLYCPHICYSNCIVPHLYVPKAVQSHISMFPQLYSLTYLFSHSCIISHLYVPIAV